MKDHPAEQAEIVFCGNRLFVYFKDKLDTTIRSFGRPYPKVTDASLERLVKVMNSDLCNLEVKKDGRFIIILARRAYPSYMYTEQEWREVDGLDERSEYDCPEFQDSI